MTADAAEKRVLAALRDRKPEALRALAKEIAALDAAERRKLTVRLLPDAVEFRFRGEFPGDDLPAGGSIEFVVGRVKEREYEALLVAGAAELARVKRLGDALAPLAARRHEIPAMHVRLLWVEDGRAHAEGLADFIDAKEPAEKRRLLDGLSVDESGMRTPNVELNRAVLPRKRCPAEVVLTLPLPAGGKK